MENLIKALQIFLKYGNPKTQCEHDVLYICELDPVNVTDEDKRELDTLGFFVDKHDQCFKSYHYGSA